MKIKSETFWSFSSCQSFLVLFKGHKISVHYTTMFKICLQYSFAHLCTVWFSYTVHCLIFQMCRYWKKFTYSYGGFTKYDFEAQVKILKNLISHEINSLLFHICQHFFILWINSCCIHHFHWIIDVQQKRYFSVTWFSI